MRLTFKNYFPFYMFNKGVIENTEIKLNLKLYPSNLGFGAKLHKSFRPHEGINFLTHEIMETGYLFSNCWLYFIKKHLF